MKKRSCSQGWWKVKGVRLMEEGKTISESVAKKIIATDYMISKTISASVDITTTHRVIES